MKKINKILSICLSVILLLGVFTPTFSTKAAAEAINDTIVVSDVSNEDTGSTTIDLFDEIISNITKLYSQIMEFINNIVVSIKSYFEETRTSEIPELIYQNEIIDYAKYVENSGPAVEIKVLIKARASAVEISNKTQESIALKRFDNNVTIQSFDEGGNEVDDMARLLSYEIWTITLDDYDIKDATLKCKYYDFDEADSIWSSSVSIAQK